MKTLKLKTLKQGKVIMWNSNRISSSLIMKDRCKKCLKHGKMNTEYHGGKMKMKMMIWNTNYNNRLMSSSPILKRHNNNKKKMMMLMDDDLIGKVKKTTTTTISDLPEEALTEVLVRLSVKDVLTCVCVQKSWHSLIKTRMFTTLHSNYHHNISSSSSSSNPNNNKYLLFKNLYTGAYEIRVDDLQCEKYHRLIYPPDLFNKFITIRNKLVSNGLICLFKFTEPPETRQVDIYLGNPVIQKVKTLPDSPHPPYSFEWTTLWKAIAFGFVPQKINDYLVVYMVKYGLKDKPDTHSIIITCVYNLYTNSWKQITHDNIHIQDISPSNSIFVNGVAVWAGFNSQLDRILACFDTKTETLREILSPRVESHCSFPILHAFDQSIVYFVVKGKDVKKLDMWVLKGDPMNEFLWQQKITIRFPRYDPMPLLGLRNNGEPILRDTNDLISYNLDSHKFYDFVKSWKRWTSVRFRSDYCGERPFWISLLQKVWVCLILIKQHFCQKILGFIYS